MRTLLRIFVTVCLAAAATAGVARAAGAPSRVRYHAVNNVPAGSTGPYTFFASPEADLDGTLVDENTGIREAVPSPPCSGWSPLLGGADLFASCDGGSAAVYPLPQGPWRPVTLSRFCENFAGGPGMGACQVTGVGRFWISLVGSCYHCASEQFYENLQTGALGRASTTRKSAPDLNAPGLKRTLCAPLTTPAGSHVTFDGPYVLEQARRDLVVTRCGVADPIVDLTGVTLAAARPHLLLWDTTGPDGFVRGLCLPSLEPVSFAPPASAENVSVEQLTQHHIYFLAGTALGAHASYRAAWPGCGGDTAETRAVTGAGGGGHRGTPPTGRGSRSPAAHCGGDNPRCSFSSQQIPDRW